MIVTVSFFLCIKESCRLKMEFPNSIFSLPPRKRNPNLSPAMVMASSSSSSDPHQQTHLPPPSNPSPVPPVVYPSQSLPVIAAKNPNPPPPPLPSSSQLPKIQQDPSTGVPPQGILYPVSSSGRGYIPKNLRPQQPSTDQLVTVANPGGFPPSRSILPFPNHVQPFGFSPSDHQQVHHHQLHMMRPPTLQPSNLGSRPMGSSAKHMPTGSHPKVAPFPSSTPDFNGFRDLRDRSRDDTVVTINDRKVRLSDCASLYALCRSWVRNGLPQESQPQLVEGIKLLPRPLPPTSVEPHVLKRNESGDEDEEKEEDAGSVEHLSSRELLQRHIKRAKRVRARLREERLQRIERYKQRLALLLPSPVEQLKNDNGTGG